MAQLTRLVDEVLKVMRVGLTYAEGHLLQGETPLDAELPLDLPADYQRALLEALRGDSGFTAQDLEEHQGRPPIEADRATHTVMTQLLQTAFRNCYVVGEEANLEEFNIAEQAPPGALIFSLDAIDGSLPYEALNFGYSTNLLAFRRTSSGTQLLLAAVANSSHYVAVYEPPGDVWVGSLRNYASDDDLGLLESTELRQINEPLRRSPVEGAIAVVGAQPKHRALIPGLLSDQKSIVFSTGGAPASLGLMLGGLDALVSVEPQTSHDAAYLPIVAALGIPIYTDAGLHLSLPDVLNLFSNVGITHAGRFDHPVPRFIATRSPDTFSRLAPLLF